MVASGSVKVLGLAVLLFPLEPRLRQTVARAAGIKAPDSALHKIRNRPVF